MIVMFADTVGSVVTAAIAPIIVAIIALIPSVWAALSSRRVRRDLAASRSTEDARAAIEQLYGQAYDRAQRINNEVVAGLRDEIARLRMELDDVRSQAMTAERRNVDLERKYAAMERALDRMQALVNTYTDQLRGLGVQPPEVDITSH